MSEIDDIEKRATVSRSMKNGGAAMLPLDDFARLLELARRNDAMENAKEERRSW